jgi:hypothetical protein
MQQINIFHPKLTTTSGTKDSIPMSFAFSRRV